MAIQTIEEKITKWGVKKFGKGIGNLLEFCGIISKTEHKKLRQKRKACYNEDTHVGFICVACPFKYGSNDCKNFRQKYKTKVIYIDFNDKIANEISKGLVKKYL